jgi:hypothetical protein
MVWGIAWEMNTRVADRGGKRNIGRLLNSNIVIANFRYIYICNALA